MAFDTSDLVSGLLGALVASAIAAFAGRRLWLGTQRRQTERWPLAEALRVQALCEAWVLEGPDATDKLLSTITEELPVQRQEDRLWLRRVEVRAVLDAPSWNTPDRGDHEGRWFRHIKGTRRTWIVRDRVTPEIRPEDNVDIAKEVDTRPALMSSRGMEELCAWVHQVALARQGWRGTRTLSDDGLELLKPLWAALVKDNRLAVFGERLSKKAREFLEKHR